MQPSWPREWPFCIAVSIAASNSHGSVELYLEAEVKHAGAVVTVDGAGGRVANDELGHSLHEWDGGRGGAESKGE